jgi:hypothetical protein
MSVQKQVDEVIQTNGLTKVFTAIGMKTIGPGVPREEKKQGERTLLGAPPI